MEITAQVKDFEMDAISFPGVPMSFDVNADNFDTSELTNKTSDITGAVRDLDEGQTLVNGTENLMNGANSMQQALICCKADGSTDGKCP